jgi:hypothetical protein
VRTFRIVVARLGITEERHNAVTKIFSDVAAVMGDCFGSGAIISGDRLAPFFRVEPRGDLGRAYQVAEKYRQIPSFACKGTRTWFCLCRRGRIE